MVKNIKVKELIHIPTLANDLLDDILQKVNQSKEFETYWKLINVNAIDRRGMTDHGHTHFQIVANVALRLTRLLNKHNVEMSVTKDFGLDYYYAEVIVFLASILHDIGMSVEREGHEEYSLIIANQLIKELLIDMEVENRIIVTSEVLHAIISHRSGGKPKTLEAGILRVADALDMSKGRSRIPYEAGYVDIHSVSAAAIDNVLIEEGNEKPISILVQMNNSAGIFQVDGLLKKKLIGSGIEDQIQVIAEVLNKQEKNLIQKVNIFPEQEKNRLKSRS